MSPHVVVLLRAEDQMSRYWCGGEVGSQLRVKDRGLYSSD